MTESILQALIGGMLIGAAVSFMLYLHGRITGISGIFNGFLTFQKGDMAWRAMFLFGLVSGGIAFRIFDPERLENITGRPIATILIAGFLVGFGTVMGSGCTSGHGVCGISRLSPRSIVATSIFILTGMLSVAVYRIFFG